MARRAKQASTATAAAEGAARSTGEADVGPELEELERTVSKEFPELDQEAPAGARDPELPPLDPTEEAVLGMAEAAIEDPAAIEKVALDLFDVSPAPGPAPAEIGRDGGS